MTIIIRSDDWDFRLTLEQAKAIHQLFIDRDLIETAVIQPARYGNHCDPPKEMVEYLKTEPHWDLQLHGWSHEYYDQMVYGEIYKDILAGIKWMEMTFGVAPTTWYTPWNCDSYDIRRVGEELGLAVDNESYDIEKFIREMKEGTYKGHSFYFHSWKESERNQLKEALNLIKEKQNEGR